MLIIGIDPGIKGAICILKDGKILDVFDMPIMPVGKKNKSQVNGSQIYNEIQKAIIDEDKKDIKVVIEQVSAMPGQGVTSMFNFGQSFGVLKGIFSAMQIPMDFISPVKWKKYFNLILLAEEASVLSSNFRIKPLFDKLPLYHSVIAPPTPMLIS